MVSAFKKSKSSDDGYIPFAIRFEAWWEGIDPNALLTRKRGSDENPLAIQIDEDNEEEDVAWSEDRVSFCRRLWEVEEEDEVVHPGGADYTIKLMKPMNLSSEVSGADLSAGLGGGTRKMAKELNTYIDGYEEDVELAALANELSKKHGMERRTPIQHYNPEELELPARKFAGVLSRERTFRLKRKHQFLETVFNSLKPRGHLVLTEFVVLQESDIDSDPVQAWMQREPVEFDLWTAEDYRKTLVGFGMDCRIVEDETDDFRSILLQGWQRFVEGLSKPDLNREFINEMMQEAEYWLMLIRALESRKLRYYRYHAIRGGESA